VAAFQKEFLATLLRFDIESSAVIEPVLGPRCAVGVAASRTNQFAPDNQCRDQHICVTDRSYRKI